MLNFFIITKFHSVCLNIERKLGDCGKGVIGKHRSGCGCFCYWHWTWFRKKLSNSSRLSIAHNATTYTISLLEAYCKEIWLINNLHQFWVFFLIIDKMLWSKIRMMSELQILSFMLCILIIDIIHGKLRISHQC